MGECPVHSPHEKAKNQPQETLCPVCAGGYDFTAETDAYPSLLQEYVEAAYLLPQHADPADRSTTSEVEGSSSRQLPANSEAVGSLKLFYEAMLPSQPLYTRLTSCACLLRLWIAGTANPQSAVPSSNTNGSIASDFCDCLEAGLQVGLHAHKPSQCLHI